VEQNIDVLAEVRIELNPNQDVSLPLRAAMDKAKYGHTLSNQ
jgi:hypothetical protein